MILKYSFILSIIKETGYDLQLISYFINTAYEEYHLNLQKAEYHPLIPRYITKLHYQNFNSIRSFLFMFIISLECIVKCIENDIVASSLIDCVSLLFAYAPIDHWVF